MRLTHEAQVMPSMPTESSIGALAMGGPSTVASTYSPGVYQSTPLAPTGGLRPNVDSAVFRSS